MVRSLSMCDGVIYSFTGDYATDIDTESLDISSAFLQGLKYSELAEQARALGYESRAARQVFIEPPENVWRHFRRMKHCPSKFKISEASRHLYVLLCLCAMYGFVDAPLMFQLALLAFLVRETDAIQSMLDDNYLY